MVQQKPIEWRRFERIQLEGEVAKGASARPAPSLPPSPSAYPPAKNAPSLLHEFERVLRENERLRLELSTLREKYSENNGETGNNRDEQRRNRPGIALLSGGDSDHKEPSADLTPDASMVTAPVARPAESIAQVVAGYVFDKPTGRNIRLVADALRARGIRAE